MITPMGLPFTYPPLGAVVAIPLTLAPFRVIKIAWIAMICGPLLISAWFGFRPLLVRLGRGAPAALAVIAAASALLYPVNQEFYFGQVDIFLVALCLLDCVVKHPRWPRGLLIGFAAAIKLEPGAFIVYLRVVRRRVHRARGAGGSPRFGCLLDRRDLPLQPARRQRLGC
jgi:alpha-1,2-mannosyltransferase